jgi:effector-binding domain-containing protein
MNPAYSAIFQWIEANRYQRSGPGRELTLAHEPGGDETKSITEIQFPLAMESPDAGPLLPP